jgi:hypothetical protein
MSLAAFPFTPYYLEGGFAQEQRFTPASTEMDDGPVGGRRWARIRARREAFQWLCTAAEKDSFETFFDETLIDGTLRFTLATPNSDLESSTSRTCHFEGQRPKITPAGGGQWIIAGQMTVYP